MLDFSSFSPRSFLISVTRIRGFAWSLSTESFSWKVFYLGCPTQNASPAGAVMVGDGDGAQQPRGVALSRERGRALSAWISGHTFPAGASDRSLY